MFSSMQFSYEKYNFCTQKNQMHRYKTGGSWLGKVNLIILVKHRLNMSQQHVAAAQRANATQHKYSTENTGKDIWVLCCAGQPTLEILCSDTETTIQESY